jgi:sulfoxide reductase heme-binding subunit YedZ
MRAAKAVLFLLCLVPVAILVWRLFAGRLGANPIEFITHATGDWTLRFLLITLCVTPARELFRQPKWIGFRKMLGLFAFFYACLHLLTYLWLDQFFDWRSIIADIGKRPFITAGFAGFLALVPLAITSTAGWIRRLGGQNWRRLHTLIYFSATAGVVHYYWLVKSDIRLPVMYGTILALLLGYRVYRIVSRKRERFAQR